jgi:hypothetical protein
VVGVQGHAQNATVDVGFLDVVFGRVGMRLCLRVDPLLDEDRRVVADQGLRVGDGQLSPAQDGGVLPGHENDAVTADGLDRVLQGGLVQQLPARETAGEGLHERLATAQGENDQEQRQAPGAPLAGNGPP